MLNIFCILLVILIMITYIYWIKTSFKIESQHQKTQIVYAIDDIKFKDTGDLSCNEFEYYDYCKGVNIC